MGTRIRLARAYYDLATMLDAGLPILRSLDIVVEGRKGRFRRIFSRVREGLSKGSTLAESMSEYPHVFTDMDRMVIESAETAGSVGESFKMLSQWHEFVYRITRRMQMALIYPFFLMHAAGLILPFPDLILGRIGFAAYLLAALRFVLLLYIPTGIVLLMLWLKRWVPLLRLPLDVLALRIPVLGTGVFHMSVCRYAKAFGMLYKAGVPIAECTERATRATGNSIVAQKFAGGIPSVRAGGMASEGFSRGLPAEYLHLWQVGEETGQLDQTTDKIAEISGDRADLYFTEFCRWLPRIVYFVIMGILACKILSMASQVYNPSNFAF